MTLLRSITLILQSINLIRRRLVNRSNSIWTRPQPPNCLHQCLQVIQPTVIHYRTLFSNRRMTLGQCIGSCVGTLMTNDLTAMDSHHAGPMDLTAAQVSGQSRGPWAHTWMNSISRQRTCRAPSGPKLVARLFKHCQSSRQDLPTCRNSTCDQAATKKDQWVVRN